MNATLITGASGGIGEAIAVNFATKKHNLVLVARNEDKLKKLCKDLSSKYEIECNFVATDLSKTDSPQKIYDTCVANGWNVNVLINNAGIGSSGEFAENNLQSELEIIQINNSALVALTHLFLQQMKINKSGYIINIASLIAFIPSPYMAVYAGSKHFVKTFTYSIVEECRPYNVKVMLFSPGVTSSNFMETKANNNEWGKALTSKAYAQTPKQVADELLRAFEDNKEFHISGGRNRLNINITKLIPQRMIARIFGKQKQKQMGM